MNKKETRQTAILEILSKHEKIEVVRLSELCGVSLVTIRKDLTELEHRNLLRREQGYAIMNNENNLKKRLITNHLVKRQLAKAACALVKDGDTVMIESGTCCILLAEEICKSRSNVTIITNSVFMADYLKDFANLHLVLLGGDYQADSQAVVGPVTHMSAKAFHVDKIFIGTDGYHAGVCFTGDNHLRVETLRKMAECADEIAIITESGKFKKPGIVSLFTLDEIRYLVTDSDIPTDIKSTLESHDITILIPTV